MWQLESSKKEVFADLPLMPTLKADKEKGKEEVKEGTGIKVLTPNKLLTKRPVLLAQIKTGNHSYKLKN